jgi:acyl-homoserine-lactone acylase
MYGGKVVHMTPQKVTVQARMPDGSLVPQTHTFGSSRFGPIAASPSLLLTWTPTQAYAIADADASNFRAVDQWLAIDDAQNVSQLRKAENYWQGTPWVNTIAADNAGHTYYSASANTPHVTNAQLQRCVGGPVGIAFAQLAPGLPVLDGSNPACDLGTDHDAVLPGRFGPARRHNWSAQSADYVENSNNSHWLVNTHVRLTGFPTIFGPEATAQRPRTRSTLHQIDARLAGTDGQPGHRFSLAQLEALDLNNLNYSGTLARDAAVQMCDAHPQIATSSGVVDVSAACPILANWDLHANPNGRGEALWREFWLKALAATPSPWATPFDASDPVNTPNTLNTNNPQVSQALGDAVQALRTAGIPLDAPPSEVQGVHRNGEFIPVPGCEGESEGCLNAVDTGANPITPDVPANGHFGDVKYGSGFMTATQFNGTGCPTANSILTYSESENPASPHYADQTRVWPGDSYQRRTARTKSWPTRT